MAERTRCTIDGCRSDAKARGWCSKHYQRWRRHGHPETVQVIQHHGLSDYDRFMQHVDTSGGPDACHPWTRARNRDGYGWFGSGGASGLAPRWLLGYLRGEPLRTDEYACHHCDNSPCVNERHLYVGDHERNMRDKAQRGRAWSPQTDAQRAQTHCLRGHDLANARVSKRGKRQCEVCRNELRRIRYRRAKEARA